MLLLSPEIAMLQMFTVWSAEETVLLMEDEVKT